MKAIRAEVHGYVQGVGFRYTTRRFAHQIGVVGWVRNLPSGAVEVWAQGPAEAVDRLAAFLEQGPRGARVDRVVVRHVEADSAMQGFDVKF